MGLENFVDILGKLENNFLLLRGLILLLVDVLLELVNIRRGLLQLLLEGIHLFYLAL